MLIIVPGPASVKMGEKIAEILNLETINVEFKVFPDGESYLRLKRDIKGEKAIIVQSTYPPQDTHLFQLYLLIDTVLRQGVKEVTVTVPYLAYSRQDKIFRPNEVVSVVTILRILEKLGVARLITVNIHESKVFQNVSFSCINLSATRILAEYFKSLNDVVAFAPDVKAKRMAEEASQVLGGPYGWFRKERDRVTGEITMNQDGDVEVKNREVVLFDDIISTGATTAKAVKILKDRGASHVYAACIHALLREDAYKKIIESGAEVVVATDTTPSEVSKVSVVPLIAQTLKNIS